MKSIFRRIYLYFALVLIVLITLIGLVFTNLNRLSIMQVYEQQQKDLAKDIAIEVNEFVNEDDVEGFSSYIKATENFGAIQNTDIWIVANPDTSYGMSEDFATVDITTTRIPEGTKKILEKAYNGSVTSYNDYDSIYEKTILHLASPITNSAGNVIGVILLNAQVEGQEQSISQYQEYMVISIGVGLIIALLLSVLFSRQIAQPIRKMKSVALMLSAGNYQVETDIHRKDEIGELATSMNILSKRLEQAKQIQENEEQSRRDFFSKVSHELRTPITVVKGYAETLVDGYVTEEDKQREYYQRILSECGGMERLVTDLLTLSKMQNPEFSLNMELINVIAVLQDSIRSVRGICGEHDIQMTMDYDDECSLIEGDYDRVRQLFLIVLQNAIKYSKDHTAIHAQVTKTEHIIKVEIHDQGRGIAKEDQDKIFEKFYRAAAEDEKDGSGLGLVVANHIMKRHHGKIYVESEVGVGSNFVMEFPTQKVPSEME